MKRLIFCLMSVLTSCNCVAEICHRNDRVYVDSKSLKYNENGDAFYLHAGDNIWLSTNSIHRDHTGMFAYEFDLFKTVGKDYNLEYQKKWKCPYCHMLWKVGEKCQNEDCPSKYKHW